MNYTLSLLEVLKAVYALTFLTVFSVQDYRRREVSDNLVYLFIGGSVVFLAFTVLVEGLNPYYTAFSAIVPAVFALMHAAGSMGEGDVLVVAALTMLYPNPSPTGLQTRSLLPPIYSITMYSALSVVVLSLLHGFYTTVRYSELLKNIPLKYRLVYPFIAKPMTIGDFVNSDFYYPLVLLQAGGRGVEAVYRLHYDIREDLNAHKETLRELVEKNLVSRDTYIWVSYGIPFMIPLLVGTLTFMLLGDTVLLALLGVLLGFTPLLSP
ncbi:MAG: prepilin peptidase [Desulfurococcus sp.]|nr:prepilin peptidase [Desulfurococcus sp.]